MNIRDVYWHDGILKNILIREDRYIFIDCKLYIKEDSESRELFQICCSNVISVTCTLDFISILDNARSGNFIHGKINSKNKDTENLKLYLSDGYIDVTSESITIKKMKE